MTLPLSAWKIIDRIEWSLLEPLPLKQLIDAIQPELAQLVPAPWSLLTEYDPEEQHSHRWYARNFPDGWFENYPQMADEDFVRDAALRQPHRVLAEDDILPLAELKNTHLYREARARGLCIEHVMAVAFPVGPEAGGGLALFRETGKGFSESERQAIAEIVPSLRTAFRFALRSKRASIQADLLEGALSAFGTGIVSVSPKGHEELRTAYANEVIARWFPPHERRGELPPVIADRMHSWIRKGLPTRPPAPMVLRGDCVDLVVAFHSINLDGTLYHFVTLRENAHETKLPEAWKTILTPREAEVAGHILNGRSNEAIAALCGCALYTVKKHIQHIFDKLGVPSRSALCSLAARSA